MKKKSIKVPAGKYVIIKPEDRVSYVSSTDLLDDIAFRFIVKEGSKYSGGVARSISMDQVVEIFKRYDLDASDIKIQVEIDGGIGTKQSYKYEKDILETFSKIDDGREIFNIECKMNDVIHANFCYLLGAELTSEI